MPDPTPFGTPTFDESDVLTTTAVTDVPAGVSAAVAGGTPILLRWTITVNNATPPSTPSGWLLPTNGQASTTALSTVTVYRWATSSEPASYSATTPNARHAVTMSAWTNVDPTTPFDVAAPAAVTGTSAITFPAITTATAGAVILGIASGTRSGPATLVFTGTNGDGFVGQASAAAASGTNPGVGIMYEAMPTAGSFTPTVTTNGTTVRSIGQTFALRPAPATAQHESGGATATVTAVSVGAGTASETASGGGSATTVAPAVGAGTAAESASGGGTTTATAVATGAGTATEAASGGAAAVLEVTTTGGGTGTDDPPAEQHESGGGAVTTLAVALGAGVAAESAVGGELATVLVVSVGAGEKGEPVDPASPTPPSRTTTVALEPRATILPAETRTTTISAEDRATTIPSDDRTTTIKGTT